MAMLSKLFEFQVSPWELILRGTLIYWFLFLLFRFFLRRDSGAVGLADILVVVLIADAAQNGMAGDSRSVGEAMVLIGAIVSWNYLIDRLSFHSKWFGRFSEPRVVTLVQDGRILRKNLAKEMITEDELQSQLRLNGVDELGAVKRACLEPDGHISVIRHSKAAGKGPRAGLPGAG